MKTTGAIFAGILAVLPCSSFSQTIPVRAGEHRDFTRVVVRIPDQSEWRIETEPGRVDIIFDNYTGSFNTNNFFSRIPKSRVVEVEAVENGFSLALSCECDVETFIANGRFLAVDILEGPPLQPGATLNREADTASSQPLTSEFAFGDLLWSGQSEETSQSNPSIEDAELSENESALEQTFLADARSRLQSSFMSAASRGILTPSLTIPPASQADPRLPADPPPASILTERANRAAPPEYSNIRVTNSSDRIEEPRTTEDFFDSATCLENRNLDVLSWVERGSDVADLGEIRSRLFDDLDRVQPEVAIELTRAYLYYGLGPEAKQVLGLVENVHESAPELFDIADVMEFGFARNPRVIHAGLECPTSLSMWSIMSAKNIPDSQVIDTDAVLRSISPLPDHLRKMLAPTIAQRLIDFGDSETADAVLRTIQRIDERGDAEAELALASLQIARGETHGGRKKLEDLVSNDPTIPPEAIIELMEEKVLDGSSVDPDLALLVEAYAFQLSDSDLGPELLRAQVIALAKSAQFRPAFLLLQNHLQKTIFAENLGDIQGILLRELTKNAEDIIFLSIVSSSADTFSPNIDVPILVEAVKRLRSIGFPEIASIILYSNPESLEYEEGRVQSAGIHVDQGRPESALQLLEGIESADADKIRAKANELMGNNSEANLIYSSAGDADSAQRNAWLSDSWTTFIEDADPTFGPSKSLSESALPSIQPQMGMLDNLQQLLSDSVESRRTLSNLLNVTAASR